MHRLITGIGYAVLAVISFSGFYGLLKAAERDLHWTKFKSGACIQVEEREPWDHREVWRVEMVGNHNYLVRKYPDSLFRDSVGTEISFLMASSYHEVPCPK